jgi:predicted nucleic-acid-binding Zn-ribbon protein
VGYGDSGGVDGDDLKSQFTRSDTNVSSSGKGMGMGRVGIKKRRNNMISRKLKKIIIACPHCNDKVSGQVIATNGEDVDPIDDIAYTTISFIRCAKCKNSVLIKNQLLPKKGTTDWSWQPDERLWPNADFTIDPSIPLFVRKSLEEADLCFRTRAYSACAVMCGKTLEGIGVEYKVKSKNLSEMLKELKEMGVIDNRIMQWSQGLRRLRNIGAHATFDEVTKEDASDLLEFIRAICEYIFALERKYSEFKNRLSKKRVDI